MLLADLDDCQFGDNVEFGEVLARSKLQNGSTLKFSAWLKIAYGQRDGVTTAKTMAGFDVNDPVRLYRDDANFRTAIEHFRARFPNLFGFSLDVDTDLNWMADASFGYWSEVLPPPERDELTSPAIIRSRFEKYLSSYA
jgi:hypothetical protein